MRAIILLLTVVSIFSCAKNSVNSNTESGNSTPAMGFRTLNNQEINLATNRFDLDVNEDGDLDLTFEVKRDNDDLKQIKQASFRIISSFYSSLPLNGNNEVEPMIQSTYIPTENFKGNTWKKEATVSILEKSVTESGSAQWRGNWANVGRKYLPFQLQRNNERFGGWIELTIDNSNGKIILHKAAFSKVSGKTIKAGFDY